MNATHSIPKPLVDSNQIFIIASVIISWITTEPWILFIPFLAVFAGVLLKYNPVIQIGRLFLRKAPAEYRQEDAAQQRFNAGIASGCLGASLISSGAGWATGYYLFSGMVLAAASIALAGFCIGCFVRYQWQRLRFKMRTAK
ncbi:DUF4395 domain-containing protein [Rossellomorea aquimaris]|uniref:DUF4395 domain-containing protein n=1 Tax=Rossellomorea aquimaris TaxID=189382 RepID=A0A1J6W1G1_9BACI|nr:DUF4395 domain-containing protein [Rossellomorea aquimaris]OIU71437.1 hypothetical protein BHE18_10475 [Rossellomorea aquimaris]